MPTVVTLPAYGDAPALEAQLAFHAHAGADAVIVHGARLDDGSRAVVERFARQGAAHVSSAAEADKVAEELGAGWIIAAAPYEFWWPRGARYDAILSRVPSEYGVVQGLVRVFLRVDGEQCEPFLPGIHRLSPQAYYRQPDDSPLPELRLVRRVGLGVGGDPGGIPSSALRPLRGWYPIEVLSFPRTEALSQTEIEDGLERGIVQRDPRLRDMLEGLANGEPQEFARPSLVDAAWYAADAAVLGEADTFLLQERLDQLERRLAGLEESLVVRVDRKLRSAFRLGRGRP